MMFRLFSCLFLFFTCVSCNVDNQTYHNVSAHFQSGLDIRGKVNRFSIQGFGRVLTWNVKKLGACLRQDNTEQLKEVVCVILQSANLVVLQEADNLDLSCLPCSNILKDQYEWPDDEVTDDFKVLIKTKHEKRFTIKNYGSCTTGATKKSKLDQSDAIPRENIYQSVMRRLRWSAAHPTTTHRENIHRKLAQQDAEMIKTVEGFDIHPVSSKEVPEQEESFYNHDWIEGNDNDHSKQTRFHSNKHATMDVDKTSDETQHFRHKQKEHKSALEKTDGTPVNHTTVESFSPQDQKNTTGDLPNQTNNAVQAVNKTEISESIGDKNATEELRNKTDSFDNESNKTQIVNNKDAIEQQSHTPETYSDSHKNQSDNIDNSNIHNDSEINHRFHQDQDIEDIKAEEELKDRLLESKGRLYKASLAEKKAERFVVINNQLNSIDRELLNVEGDLAKTKVDLSSKKSDSVSNISDSHSKRGDSFSTKSESSSTRGDFLGSKSNRFFSGIVSSTTERIATKKTLNTKGNRFHDNIIPDIRVSSVEHKNTRFKQIEDKEGKRNETIELNNKGKITKLQQPRYSPLDPVKSFSQTKEDESWKGIDFDSEKMHHLVHEVLLQPSVKKDSEEYMKYGETSLTRNKVQKVHMQDNFISRHTNHMINTEPERALKRWKRNDKKSSTKKKRSKTHSKKRKPKRKVIENAEKRDINGIIRKQETNSKKNLNYIIMTIKSDLNSGNPFILANVKLPKDKNDQRACIEKIMSEISNANSESEEKLNVFMMGDVHFDRLTGADSTGDLFKILTNLQIDGETYHSPLSYHEKDPITTVYGRRFDNILTNMNLKGNLKTIGPDFPTEPEGIILPLTLQRLYNNYIVALYTSDNDDSDSIYSCIKAFQTGGKSELDNTVCKDSWVPSSYVSDHLPLIVKIKINVSGKPAPLELNIASWNIQGDTFKERLMDPAIKKAFFAALKSYHLAIFHEFPPHDRILDDDELGSSDILRLKEGDLTTEFGIYVSEDVKDGETDMFVLRKKIKDDDGDDETLDKQNMITTVGLFAPKLVVNTEKIKPCIYAVKTSGNEISSSNDFEKVMNAIDKDVKTRKCDFKILLASLNLDMKFDLDREIYREYKYINMKCEMTDEKSKYKYNIPRSRDLADYVIILDKDSNIEFDKCSIGLPGDEGKRGIDKLSDFEELTTHYPLSMVVKNKGP